MADAAEPVPSDLSNHNQLDCPSVQLCCDRIVDRHCADDSGAAFKSHQDQANEFAQLHRATLLALVDLTELRDSSVTGKHVYRLHHYADLLTDYFDFDQDHKAIISGPLLFTILAKWRCLTVS